MNTRQHLQCINFFLSRVYGADVHIGSLLRNDFNNEQIRIIMREMTNDFLRLFIFGLQCRFAYSKESIRLFNDICCHFGLDGLKQPEPNQTYDIITARATALISTSGDVDLLRNIAILAAMQTLHLQQQYCLHDELLFMGDAKSASISQPSNPNHGEKWTAEMDEALETGFLKGMTIKQLAKAMGRSTGGISARLKKQGLINN